MKQVDFLYTTKLTFDDYVRNHSFALRAQPIVSPAQKILASTLHITPFVDVWQTTDAFGNSVTCGYLEGQHRFLDFELKGGAQLDLTQAKTDYMACYLYPSEFTKPGGGIAEFYENKIKSCPEKDAPARAAFISQALSEVMTYEPGATNSATTAAQAFELKKGVCQDYAHIMLSLLRLDGIAARYMAGLAFSSGETHAWVEFWDGERWQGYDPANNHPLTEEYLVLSQGRDFGDCSIDRGVMYGDYTRQMQLVRSTLKVREVF